MSEITRGLIARVGVDLAKSVIQVHAVDAAGHRVVARSFRREQFLVSRIRHIAPKFESSRARIPIESTAWRERRRNCVVAIIGIWCAGNT